MTSPWCRLIVGHLRTERRQAKQSAQGQCPEHFPPSTQHAASEVSAGGPGSSVGCHAAGHAKRNSRSLFWPTQTKQRVSCAHEPNPASATVLHPAGARSAPSPAGRGTGRLVQVVGARHRRAARTASLRADSRKPAPAVTGRGHPPWSWTKPANAPRRWPSLVVCAALSSPGCSSPTVSGCPERGSPVVHHVARLQAPFPAGRQPPGYLLPRFTA